MQLNVKKIDEKLMTLTKMQSTLRNKKIDYLTFLEASNLEFPPIASVLVTFPLVKKERNEIKNSHKRKSIVELDRYLQSHHDKISQDIANRIIFASPLRNRITFQKTFFRSRLAATMDNRQMRNSLESTMERKEKERSGLSLAPNKFAQDIERFTDFKTKLLAELGERAERYKTKQMRMEINPEERKKSFIQKLQAKRKLGNRIKIKRKEQELGRYSPWRSEELEDELIL